MFRLNAYQSFVSTACQLRTCSCYFLLLQVPGIIAVYSLEVSVLRGLAVQDVARAPVERPVEVTAEAVASATQHLQSQH
jgi:hypothetical protein